MEQQHRRRLIELLRPAHRRASGERRFPRRISVEEGAELLAALAAQVDHGCASRAAVAARQSLPIVCSRGCSGCCEEMVLVYLPEAAAVVRYLMRPENRESRDAFLAAFPAWQKAASEDAARMSQCVASGGSMSGVTISRPYDPADPPTAGISATRTRT